MAKDFIAYQKLVDAAPGYCNHHTDYVHHFIEAAIAHGANVFAILGAARLAQQQAEDEKRFNDAAIMTKLVELAGKHVDDCFRRGESVYGEDAENEYAAQQASSNEPDGTVLDNEPPPPPPQPETLELTKAMEEATQWWETDLCARLVVSAMAVIAIIICVSRLGG